MQAKFFPREDHVRNTMGPYSDLEIENFGFGTPHHSRLATEQVLGGFSVLHATLPEGRYHTLMAGKIWQSSEGQKKAFVEALTAVIREEWGEGDRTLVAGLGNASLPADALGSKLAALIPSTGEVPPPLPSLFVCTPGTEARSGIDTADHLRCLAEFVRPHRILVADALRAMAPPRLCTVVQVSGIGLTPGSASAIGHKRISSATMPCRVITVGVPTVIGLPPEQADSEEDTVLLTRADCDMITDCYASLLALAVRRVIFGK